MTQAYDKYKELETKLLKLMEESDLVREKMDDPWWEMTSAERDTVNKQSVSVTEIPYLALLERYYKLVANYLDLKYQNKKPETE